MEFSFVAHLFFTALPSGCAQGRHPHKSTIKRLSLGAYSIALVVALKYFTRISSVLLFWLAFVLTRPFGATLGDFLTKPHEKGGLDFGTIGSSAVLAAVLVVMIAGASYAQRRYGRSEVAELS